MMKLATLLWAWLCAMAFIAAANPAQAQLGHTWVASSGSDSANCDRPTPCATFNGALGKTEPGGEITCADSGNFFASSPLSITTSITINCENAIGSNTVTGGASGGSITINTSASDTVTLRGLDFDGLDVITSGCGETGLIYFSGAGTLHLYKIKVNHIPGCENGIGFYPSGTASLLVADSYITALGTTSTAAGIYIKPFSGVQATVSIDHNQINGNYFGIVGDGTSGGIVKGTISNSVVSGNAEDGIATIGSGSAVWFLVDQTEVSGNTFGLAAGGSGAEILASSSSVFGNSTGLHTSSGGGLYSYGNNKVNGNTSNGAFTGTIGLQ
jgi:hypothetical protein